MIHIIGLRFIIHVYKCLWEWKSSHNQIYTHSLLRLHYPLTCHFYSTRHRLCLHITLSLFLFHVVLAGTCGRSLGPGKFNNGVGSRAHMVFPHYAKAISDAVLFVDDASCARKLQLDTLQVSTVIGKNLLSRSELWAPNEINIHVSYYCMPTISHIIKYLSLWNTRQRFLHKGGNSVFRTPYEN